MGFAVNHWDNLFVTMLAPFSLHWHRDFSHLPEGRDIPGLYRPLPDIAYAARFKFRWWSLFQELKCEDQATCRVLQVDATGAVTLA